MKGKLLTLVLGISLLLAGCNWMEGSYASVEPYMENSNRDDKSIVSVSDYQDICDALNAMVESCVESRTLSLAGFGDNDATEDLNKAVRTVLTTNPVTVMATRR